jgi:hypothetical protein
MTRPTVWANMLSNYFTREPIDPDENHGNTCSLNKAIILISKKKFFDCDPLPDEQTLHVRSAAEPCLDTSKIR